MFTKKRFIIIIVISFFLGISWTGLESPVYADENTYEKVWDSGSAVSNPIYDVEVGDMDGDGKPEIIIADFSLSGSATIYVFENTGDNSYQLVWDSGSTLTMFFCFIEVGDQDKDGKLEIIALEKRHEPPFNGKLHVFENNGDNTYEEVWNTGNAFNGIEPISLFLGDADNDGKCEIVVGTGYQCGDKKIRIYENTADNAYREVWNSGNTLSDTVREGAVGDTDGDGKKEIIIGPAGIDSRVYVFENTGDNAYEGPVWNSGGTFTKSGYAVIGDQDSDGKAEIIASGGRDKRVHVFENSGDNTYLDVWNSGTLNGYPYLPATGDQDRDGNREIIIPCSDGKVYVFENTGDNAYKEVWNSGSVMSGYIYDTAVGDQDGDGKGEIIAVSYNGKIYVFEGKQTPANTQDIVEDFSVCNSEWLEYDPENKIEIDCTNDHRLEFNHWRRYQPAYVYRPFSTTDFVLEYDIKITHDGGNANMIGPGFSDTLGTKKTIQHGAFAAYYAGFGGPQIDIQTFVNGSPEWDCGGWGNLPNRIWINKNTTYYVRFEKSGDTLKLSIFSDAERTQHISGSPKAVNTNLSAVSFNYFYAVNGPHADNPGANWEWTTGWIDNIHVSGSWANQAPLVDAGLDQTVEQETYQGTEVTQTGHAYDADGDALTYRWKEGDTVLASGTIPAPNKPPTDTDVTLTHIFPPGEHTVTLTVNDGETSSSNDVLIIVQDTTPPEISVSVSPDVLWPPNHKMVNIQAAVTVSDIGDPAPTWTLVSITGNEPEEGPGKKHSPDIIGHEPGTPDLEFQLRAERPGQKEDRIYTITYQAADSSGNSVSAEAVVIVPHDKGKGKK